MSVNVIDTLKPKNNGSFPIVEAVDVLVSEGLRLPDALTAKADASAMSNSVTNLQEQIDQIEINSSTEAIVAPEVAAARVDSLGNSFQTLKARIDWAQARSMLGMGNIRESNVQDICSGDADNIPNNRVFGVSIADSATIAHFPSRYGQIVTFGTGAERSLSGDFQVFFAADSTVFYRSIWSGTWSAWHCIADGGKAMSGAFYITSDNVDEVCGGDANNLPNNRIYGISFGSTLPTNFPALSGQMVTFGTGASRSEKGDFQIFIQRTGEFYCRSIWGGTWSEWKRIDNINSFIGAGNITGSNVEAICGSDANGLPNNRIYGVSIASTASVQNFPARSGQMLTFGTGPLRSLSGDVQIFVENNGTFYYRSIWNGTWSAWRYMADGGKAVSGKGNITLTNVEDVCQSDANNLPNNRIYGVSFGSTNVSNFPARSGQIVTFGTGAERSASGDFQVFFKNDGTLYYRSIWSGVWSEWIRTGGYWAVAGMGNITTSNVTAICDNNADNVPNNRIYGVSISVSTTVTNFPARSGQMITFGCANVRSASGDSQIFIENTGTVYYRSNWNGVWSAWKTVADGGKAVSGAFNITLTNVADVCGSDANNLPNNRIYGVSFGTTNVANFPARQGQIATFGTGAERSASGDFQIFFKNDGTFYYRTIWNGTWSEWIRTCGYWAVAGSGNITTSNVATICDNDADNVPNNRIYGISISTSATVANFPARSGQMITFGCSNVRSASGDSQIFIQNNGTVYYRSNWNTVWSAWRSIASEQPVKILTLGDSIALGDRNGNKGFVGDIGYPYKNIAVGGARLSYDPNVSYKNIPQQLIDETEYDPDIIVANGGINDYIFNYPLGTISAAPVTTDEEAANLNKETLTGGAEYLFYQMHKKYPYAQRYFVIVHKVQRDNGDYYPTRQNSQGYTQQDMHDRLVAVCKLYNVEVIDVYDDGIINTKYPVYRSTVWWREDHSITAYVDVDGLHPCPQGYLHGYAPLVKRAIQSGTSKG